MKKLFTLIILAFAYYSNAQFPINSGTSNVDWFGQSVITSDNNLLISGSTNYIGNGTSGDVSLRKVDLNGNTIWSQAYGVGGSEDLANGIISTSDGSYIIFGGHTKSYAGSAYTGGTNYYSASYIIKVDAAGNQIWAKSLGGSSYGDNYAMTVVENSNGEYICYGHVQNHSGCSSYSTRILKLSSSGAVLWSNCMSINPDLIAGFTRIQGENNYVGVHNQSGTVVLRKYNDNGVVTNQINYQYQGFNTTSSKLISNTNGEFYLLGTTNNKAVVAKFDNSMNLIWDTTFLTTYNSRFSDLKQHGTNLVLVGDIEVIDATNEYDFWLVKITPTGQFVSEYVHPSSGIDVYSRGGIIFQNDMFITGQIATSGVNQHAVKIDLNSAFCANITANITPQSSTTFCQGGFVNLNASSGSNYTYEWYKDGNIINGANASVYQANASGNYTVKVIDGACNATSSAVSVVVNATPSNAVTVTGNTTFCQGGIANLTAQGTGTYLWSNGATTQTISVNQTGNYSVVVTQNGCNSSSSSTTITVNPFPTANITPQGNTTICQGGFVNLNASTGSNYTYEWYKDGNLINGANANVYQAIASGDYTVKVINGSCNATSAAATVVVNATPSNAVTVTGNTTFCQGGSATLTAQGTGTYLWSNGATSQAITVNQTGNYSVIVTQNGCNSTSSSTAITVNPIPTATITPQSATTFCQGGFVNLVASGGATYQWNTGAQTTSITANQSGTYSVNVFNQYNCQASASQAVTVNANPTVTLSSIPSVVYKTSAPIQLVGNPTGGTFSGAAVSGSTFTPANAALGLKVISYNYTSQQGCSGSASQTTIVADTVGNVCSTYDTLIITVHFTSGINANTSNSIKFYPNPTNDILNIDNGNYQAMNGYSIKIVSLTGAVIYNQPITTQSVQISMNDFGTTGLYFAQIIDPNNAIVDSKKIVLE